LVVLEGIKRLYPHPLHRRLHAKRLILHSLDHQEAAQHPSAVEQKLQMQPVETPHDRKITLRHQPRQAMDAAAADAQNLRLVGARKIVRTVDRRSLSNPALLSAPSKKLFSNVSSPIFACSDFTSIAGRSRD
jgi:hypothetical protein